MKTVSCVDPDGTASLENAVLPLNANSELPPLVTAVKADALLPLAQVNLPLETAHAPLLVESVNPEPLAAVRYVARVWVDHVPPESSPPVDEPLERSAVTVNEDGTPVGVLPPPPVLVLVGELPDLGKYLIPELGQALVEKLGALIAVKAPSMTEPFRWK